MIDATRDSKLLEANPQIPDMRTAYVANYVKAGTAYAELGIFP